ncbi:MAG: septum formation initiator family protein [Oscillospiraceae bacterium]
MKAQKAATIQKFSFILSLCLLLVAGYFVISLVKSNIEIKEKNAEAENIKAQYEQQVADNARLQEVVDGGNQQEYIERVAREKLGYVMPDEKVYYNITPGNE